MRIQLAVLVLSLMLLRVTWLASRVARLALRVAVDIVD